MFGCLGIGSVLAHDKGQHFDTPDVRDYYLTLRQPDNAMLSCCGEGDAYYADKQEEGPNGELIAIITDTRENGPLKRKPIAVGTKIVVPPHKRRRVPIYNPTGHTVIFVGGSPEYNVFIVYCYEPLPLG